MIICIWTDQHWENTCPMLIETFYGQVRLAASHIERGVRLNSVCLGVGGLNRQV